MKTRNDFCVFILSHGRPNNVKSYHTLRDCGYDGPIYIVIDNEDKTANEYYKNFENVVMFDKAAQAQKTDLIDNFGGSVKAIVTARNASFEIAKELGFKYFLQFDDDYPGFYYRSDHRLEHPESTPKIRRTLGDIVWATLDFYINLPSNVKAVAFSQGGDWFGGKTAFNNITERKAMNSFFCSTERQFRFKGRINEDVNTYVSEQSKGIVFLNLPQVQLTQVATQTNKGGMTDIYEDNGTYIKSFYSVICSPSCININMMGTSYRRFHHRIDWRFAVPKIISEKHKK